MYEQIINNTVCRVFESVEELLAGATSVQEDSERFAPFNHADDSGFTGRRFTCGWSSIYASVRSAWDEGMEVLDGMLRDLDDADLPKPVSRRRKPRFDENDGDEIDHDRLRAGQSYWRTCRRQSTRGPSTITLMVDVCAHCRVDARNILWRGAAAIALAKRLEEAGYRVELWAFEKSNGMYGKKRNINSFHAVCLKRASEPLDISTLINIVSGWAFRTVWFRADCMGTLPVAGNLGHPGNPTPAELDLLNRDEHRIVIADVWNRDAAVALVRDTLKKVGA